MLPTEAWRLQDSFALTSLWWMLEWGQNIPQSKGGEMFFLLWNVGNVLTEFKVWSSVSLVFSLIFFLILFCLFSELNRNRIRQVEGLTFQGLSSLEVLKLQRNSISKLTDGAFWDLAKMKVLYVKKLKQYQYISMILHLLQLLYIMWQICSFAQNSPHQNHKTYNIFLTVTFMEFGCRIWLGTSYLIG